MQGKLATLLEYPEVAEDEPQDYEDEDGAAPAPPAAQLLRPVTGRQAPQKFAHAARVCTDRTGDRPLVAREFGVSPAVSESSFFTPSVPYVQQSLPTPPVQ